MPIQVLSGGALLQRKPACACGGGCPRCQTAASHLKISEPDDPYEREADRIAEQVMRMPEVSPGNDGPPTLKADRVADPIMRAEDHDPTIRAPSGGRSLQRSCACGGGSKCTCPSEDARTDAKPDSMVLETEDPSHLVREHAIMRKGLNGGPCESAPDEEQAQQTEQQSEEPETTTAMAKATPGAGPNRGLTVASLPAPGGGSLLPAETRSFMEPRFGHGFGGVRVHADGEADRLSRVLHAEAFTLGTEVYFRAGRFQPSTETGRRLLAHELAHVVQQSQGTVGRHVQRFTLTGFPASQDAAMHTAIPIASSTMRSCTSPWLHNSIADKIDSATYVYNANLGLCGKTNPAPWADIQIGSSAFSMATCCKLESTIAHEASHTRGFVEPRARKLECDCFSCCV